MPKQSFHDPYMIEPRASGLTFLGTALVILTDWPEEHQIEAFPPPRYFLVDEAFLSQRSGGLSLAPPVLSG